MVIHNHPSGDSFSFKDMEFLIENNVKEIKAIGVLKNKKIDYSLTIINSIPEDEFELMQILYLSTWQSYKNLQVSNSAHRTMIDLLQQFGEYIKYEYKLY